MYRFPHLGDGTENLSETWVFSTVKKEKKKVVLPSQDPVGSEIPSVSMPYNIWYSLVSFQWYSNRPNTTHHYHHKKTALKPQKASAVKGSQTKFMYWRWARFRKAKQKSINKLTQVQRVWQATWVWFRAHWRTGKMWVHIVQKLIKVSWKREFSSWLCHLLIDCRFWARQSFSNTEGVIHSTGISWVSIMCKALFQALGKQKPR